MIWPIHVFLEIAKGAYLIPKMPFAIKPGRSKSSKSKYCKIFNQVNIFGILSFLCVVEQF